MNKIFLAFLFVFAVLLFFGCVNQKPIDKNIFVDKNVSTDNNSPVVEGNVSELRFGVDAAVVPYAADWENGLDRMNDAGIQIARISFVSAKPVEEIDRFVLVAQERNIEVLMKFQLTGKQIPSPESFKQTVKSAVERYDFDGVNDISGLKKRVKYFEIGNEPSFSRFFSGTTEQYVSLLKAGFEAVKETCPDCVVLNGGLFDSADAPSALNIQDYKDYFNSLLSLGADNYFDILSIHIYHLDGSNWDEMIPFYKSKTSKPIWVTETGFGSSNTIFAKSTPENQAREIIIRFVKQFEQGAEKVFIFSFQDMADSKNTFSYFGLFDSQSNKKKAFFAYQTLAKKLAGFSSVSKIATGQYKFSFASKPNIFVLWGEGSLPAGLSGKLLLTDYLGDSNIVDAVSVVLGENPVFVEQK